MKVCTKCLVAQPNESFYVENRRKDGLRSRCKKCYYRAHKNTYSTWKLNNPEKVAAQGKRKWDKAFFGGRREEVLKRDNYSCVSCGMSNKEHHGRWNTEITVDHIDGKGRNSPLSEKNNDLENLQTMCSICHSKKDYARRIQLQETPALAEMTAVFTQASTLLKL